MKRIFILTVGFIVCMKLMAQSPVSFYPQENAQDINIDTHLAIEFDKAVKAGNKGVITVTDKISLETGSSTYTRSFSLFPFSKEHYDK